MYLQLKRNDFKCYNVISAIKPTRRSERIHPVDLAKKWRISVELAKITLEYTTQLNLRQPVHPITRRFRTDLSSINYKRLSGKWYIDTVFSKIKSLNGNMYAQIFCNKLFIWLYLLKSKKEYYVMLKIFFEYVGDPNKLTFDGSPEHAEPQS